MNRKMVKTKRNRDADEEIMKDKGDKKKKSKKAAGITIQVSPKMSVLLRSGRTAADKATIGYYGTFVWINDQASFDRVFGRKPTMLPLSPLLKILSR